MIDRRQAEICIKRIKASKQFRSSETSKQLLDYLVDKSVAGEVPKEIDIAIDFFQKDPSYDPSSDSLIRSHIFSLRNKLEKYYLTDGRNDKIRLKIPKGHYQVVFVNAPVLEVDERVKRYRLVLYTLAFLLMIFLVWDISGHRKEADHRQALTPISDDNPVWHDFIDSEKPTVFVLGDYFYFWEKRKWTSGDRKIRDGNINSEQDLEEFIRQNPEQAELISPNRGSYYAPELVRGLGQILPFFTLHIKAYQIQNALNLSKEVISQNNIIFIGPYKTLGLLNSIVQDLRLHYQIYPHQILLDNEGKLDYLNILLPDESHFYRDYMLVCKVPGVNDNMIMIIAFFSPGSVAEKIDPILSDEGIHTIRENFLDKGTAFPKYFEALYEINDVNAAVTANLTYFYPIDKEKYLQQHQN